MLRVARLSGLAALLSLITAATTQAQTVIATNAPQGTTLEFVLGSEAEGMAPVDATGTATVVGNEAHLGASQIDARIFVDNCGTSRRVVIVDTTKQAPPAGTCTRNDINGVFLIQRITTLVFNLGSTPPTVLVRQGPAPAAWLRPLNPNGTLASLPYERHFVLSGGVGVLESQKFGLVACGDIPICNIDKNAQSWTGGLAYWFLPFLGAEATYVKFDKLTASAQGATYHFDTNQDGGLFTFAALGNIPAGKVNIYGKFGGTYHRSTFTVNETIQDQTATVDSVTQLVSGGSQTLQSRVGGFGWVYGGGVEFWLRKPIGVYGEFGRLYIRGSDLRGGETKIADEALYGFVGVKLRLPHLF
jgi:hypothetical protein